MPVVRSNWKKDDFWGGAKPQNKPCYILNPHATKNKEPFFFLYTLICFIWTLNLLKPTPYISIDLHMNYEQRRQWRGMGSTKSPQKTKKDRLHYTLHRYFRCIDTTQLIRILEVVSSCSKFSTTYCYLGGIF